MAIQEQVEILLQGAIAWNRWRGQHTEVSIDLSDANLSGADLSLVNLYGADLSRANLSRADLSLAILSEARLSGANLYMTTLSEARLSGANLREAHLYMTTLDMTNLSGANLSHANIMGANLSGADLTDATVEWAYFEDLDLRTVKGLETVRHLGPSSIGAGTLERSQGDIPEVFLLGAGWSDTSIEYARSLFARPIEYYTCFLSYCSRDQDIAERLYADLQSKGVRCWMAPHDLRPGDYHHSRIDEAIRVHEKVLLFLSEHAVSSSWVKHEVQVALAREIAQDCTILFPLRLDEEVMHTSKDWAAQLRESRHIGDFTGWKDRDAYQTAFQRLLHDLKAES